jgi:hypothetical protein
MFKLCLPNEMSDESLTHRKSALEVVIDICDQTRILTASTYG